MNYIVRISLVGGPEDLLTTYLSGESFRVLVFGLGVVNFIVLGADDHVKKTGP